MADDVKAKESKADLFKRLIEPRVTAAINKIRVVGNCHAKARYEYTKEQVAEVFDALRDAVAAAEAKFTPSEVVKASTFKLGSK